MKLLLGCDPEVFVTLNRQIISGIGIVGGSKSNPRPVIDGTLQEDNVLAEIGITPAETEEEWVTRITNVLGQLHNHLQQMHEGLSFVVQASNLMLPEHLADPMAMQFGCDPDFDAYTSLENTRPDSNTTLRTAGGHIHFGYDTSVADRQDVIKAADVFIGLPSVILDEDKRRMRMYGGPGAFRPKSYGVEYRTPSNFWLQSEELMRWVYRQAMRCVPAATDTAFMELVNAKSSSIRSAISSGNVEHARTLCDEFLIAV